MGCTYSACLPRRGQGDDEALPQRPFTGSRVLSELGHWKERVRQIKQMDDRQRSKSPFEKSQHEHPLTGRHLHDSAQSSTTLHNAQPVKRSLSALFSSCKGRRKNGGLDANTIAAGSEILATGVSEPLTPEQAALRSNSFHIERRNSYDTSGKGSWISQRMSKAKLLSRRASEPSKVSEDSYITQLLNPPFEQQRQATLDMLRITGGEVNEQLYTGTVELAAKVFKVPYAALAFFDRDKVWYKAVHSNFPDSENKTWLELPRHMVLSSQILLLEKPRVMVVEDVMQDARFLDLVMNRMGVGSPYKFPPTAFLGAAPLLAPNGYVMGVLEILDSQPRKLDAGAFSLLINLAEMTARSLLRDNHLAVERLPPSISQLTAPKHMVTHLPVSKALRGPSGAESIDLQTSADRFCRLQETGMATRSDSAIKRGIIMCSAESDLLEGEVMYVNCNFCELTGVSAKDALNVKLKDLLDITDYSQEQYQLLRKVISSVRQVRALATLKSKPEQQYRIEVKSAKAGQLDEHLPDIGVPNFVELCPERETYRYFFILFRESKGQLDSVPSTAHTTPVIARPLQLPSSTASNLPTLAFAAAADDEPWNARESITSSSKRSLDVSDPSEPRTENSGQKSLSAKESVQLPHNIEIFEEVTLGPLLGRGSFGRVHRGFWKDELVAVKILETFKRGSMDITEVEDLAEARLVEEMKHKNIVCTYDHGTRVKHFSDSNMTMPSASSGSNGSWNGQRDPAQSGFVLETWLLLEYCNKGSLQDAIDRGWFRTEPSRVKGKPNMRTILAVAAEIARGIQYLHSNKVLHSDLTPGNVLLKESADTPHGFTVKIADFGLSRPTTSRTINTQTFGTVTHMPPELLSDGMLTKAADVYAFGVLLWSMMSGEPAWHGLRRTQVMFKVTTQEATLKTPADCPLYYKELLDSCMNRNFRARPQMSELAELLETLLQLVDDGVDPSAIHWKMKPKGNVLHSGSGLGYVDEDEPMSQEALQSHMSIGPRLSFAKDAPDWSIGGRRSIEIENRRSIEIENRNIASSPATSTKSGSRASSRGPSPLHSTESCSDYLGTQVAGTLGSSPATISTVVPLEML